MEAIGGGLQRKVLVAEEHEPTRTFLADNLTADGFDVYVADTRAKALATLGVRKIDAVIADVNGQTLDLVDTMRRFDGRIDPATPLLVLTSSGDKVAHIRLLERGSDDVVMKPFSYPELRARLEALLRRAGHREPGRIRRIGPLMIDVVARAVTIDGVPVELPKKELALLIRLSDDPSRVFTKDELMRDVWKSVGKARATRTLDSHASRLRQRLGRPEFVINMWGVGYRLVTVEQLAAWSSYTPTTVE